jgi:hypothetical protein
LAKTVGENEVLFPWIESIHVLAIVLVVGTISIVDLRLLGIASLDRTVDRLMRDVLPYTWDAFAVAAVTGGLLFSSNAMIYAHNFFFRGKLILLAVAGPNMAIFDLLGIGDIECRGATIELRQHRQPIDEMPPPHLLRSKLADAPSGLVLAIRLPGPRRLDFQITLFPSKYSYPDHLHDRS